MAEEDRNDGNVVSIGTEDGDHGSIHGPEGIIPLSHPVPGQGKHHATAVIHRDQKADQPQQ